MAARETVPDQQIAKSAREAVCRTVIIAHIGKNRRPVSDVAPWGEDLVHSANTCRQTEFAPQSQGLMICVKAAAQIERFSDLGDNLHQAE